MTKPGLIHATIVDRLLDANKLDTYEHKKLLAFHQQHGGRVEEALLETGLLDEPTLLRFVATLHKTKFVSTEKLASARVDKKALSAFSHKMAKRLQVFPIMLDLTNDRVIVATADPDDEEALRETKLALEILNVQCMVARPLAVEAAIERAFTGKADLFRELIAKNKEAAARAKQIQQRQVDQDDPFARARAAAKQSLQEASISPEASLIQTYAGSTGVGAASVADDDPFERRPEKGHRAMMFSGAKKLRPHRIGREALIVQEDLLERFAKLPGVKVAASLQLKVLLPEGASDDLIEEVSQACQALRFSTFGFGAPD